MNPDHLNRVAYMVYIERLVFHQGKKFVDKSLVVLHQHAKVGGIKQGLNK